MTNDRLTGLDASFLHIEDDSSHMHVASVMLFDGPPPPYDELLDAFERRLHLVPRYRQRLAFVPLGQGRPRWVDDPHLNLHYHVRATALPSPGSEEQRRARASRVFSQELDRDKPLWELWLVHGLAGGRFAVIAKTHHALVDGVSGVDIVTVLFDTSPEPAAPPDPGESWLPRPLPSGSQLLAEALVERATAPGEITRSVRAVFRAPRRAAGALRDAAVGVGAIAWTGLNPAPRTTGNRVAAMMAALPVWCRDPVTRLGLVSEQMKQLKSGGQAVGAQVLTQIGGFAPPTIMGQASRLMARQRFFNLVVTNVPGPQFPLYLMGREMSDVFPMVPLASNQALGVAIMSYNGKVNFGLVGDYDVMYDLDEVTDD